MAVLGKIKCIAGGARSCQFSLETANHFFSCNPKRQQLNLHANTTCEQFKRSLLKTAVLVSLPITFLSLWFSLFILLCGYIFSWSVLAVPSVRSLHICFWAVIGVLAHTAAGEPWSVIPLIQHEHVVHRQFQLLAGSQLVGVNTGGTHSIWSMKKKKKHFKKFINMPMMHLRSGALKSRCWNQMLAGWVLLEKCGTVDFVKLTHANVFFIWICEPFFIDCFTLIVLPSQDFTSFRNSCCQQRLWREQTGLAWHHINSAFCTDPSSIFL